MLNKPGASRVAKIALGQQELLKEPGTSTTSRRREAPSRDMGPDRPDRLSGPGSLGQPRADLQFADVLYEKII